MFKNEFATLCNAGRAKADFLEKNKVGYFVSALMAGLFIAFGGFITFTWGANLTINGAPAMVPEIIWLWQALHLAVLFHGEKPLKYGLSAILETYLVL